jgi:hypothetical protein
MNKCKCGFITIHKVTGTVASSVSIGCPVCKDTVTVKK